MGKEEIRRRLLGVTALAAEYCVTVENAAESETEEFIASMLRLLPRVYIEFSDMAVSHHHCHGEECDCGTDHQCDDEECGCGHHHSDEEEENLDEYGQISLEEEDGTGSFYPSYVDEDYYENVRRHIESLLGPDDVFLETFEEDMKYSDTPIAASISECLADIFQPLYNFISIVKESDGDELEGAYRECKENFAAYWSQSLCNVLRALNNLYYR